MRCLKCSREVPDGQVFCEECLAKMNSQPVKPGTPVTLPKRPPSQPRKAVNSMDRPEEQVIKLRAQVVRLHRWITVWIVMFMISAGALCFFLSTQERMPEKGQNYTPMETTSSQPTAG